MISPTKQKRVKSKLRADRKRSRVKPECPEIFVKISESNYQPITARAHLRNKGGYLYLSWRDRERVRTFYLGKARK